MWQCLGQDPLSAEVELSLYYRHLPYLFAADGFQFPHLSNLEISSLVCQSDLISLVEAVKCERLPQLKILHLQKRLTVCLKHLLGDPEDRFTSLEELTSRHLGAADLEILAEAAKCGQLPELQKLDLSWNTLTDCLKHLLGDPDVKFTSLEGLDLDNTNLSAGDLQVLAAAVKCGQFPQLKKLDLKQNTLTGCLKHLLGDLMSDSPVWRN